MILRSTMIFMSVMAVMPCHALSVRENPVYQNDTTTTQDTVAARDLTIIPEGYKLADTVVYAPAASLDSTLSAKSIFDILPSKANGDKADVHVHQSEVLAALMKNIKETNSIRTIPGFRIRIFSDNRQSARTDAENVMSIFEKSYPAIPAYISYANPYFKVTVGDFRTKSEAMQFLRKILPEYQKAFIVKEDISYPAIDKDNAVVLDTIKILKPTTKRTSL